MPAVKKANRKKQQNANNAEPNNAESQNSTLDMNATPEHMQVLVKKIRAVKKKLRKIYDAEAARDAGKKLNSEQERLLAEKVYYERTLKDYEDIRASVKSIDLTAQIQLLLGVFWTCASNPSSERMRWLSACLLPPQETAAGFNPLQELQEASKIAKRFLEGSNEVVFSEPQATYLECKEEVLQFLQTVPEVIPDPDPVPVEEDVQDPEPEPTEPEPQPEATPVVENVPENNPEPASESTAEPAQPQEVTKDDAPAKNADSKRDSSDGDKRKQARGNYKNRNPRRGRGSRGGRENDRGDKDSQEKSDKSSTPRGKPRWGYRENRGRGRGKPQGAKQPNGKQSHSETPKAPPTSS